MNILFVEDHWALRYSIAKEIRAQGNEVYEAESAEQALKMLKLFDIDVLVTDIGLPGMQGEVFAAEARAAHPELRLVFATGMDHIRQPSYTDQHGPVVLRKPYDWPQLSKAIEATR